MGITYIMALLNISRELDKRGIDLLGNFNVFSGVSSGAIISAVLALREKVLLNIVKSENVTFKEILRESGYEESEWKGIRERVLRQDRNCSTLILNFLMYFFKNKSKEIFVKNDNGDFPKYKNNKINIFKKYINYNLKDIPKNRILLIKSFNVQDLKIDTFTNFQKNKYSSNIPEIIDWSSNAPTYFLNNGIHIDGGNFINSSYYSEQVIFNKQKLIIFSIGSLISKINLPINQKYQWVNKVINLFYNIGKQIDNFTNETYYHLSIDLKNYQLDDIHLLSEIIINYNNININNALSFIEKNIINNICIKNKSYK